MASLNPNAPSIENLSSASSQTTPASTASTPEEVHSYGKDAADLTHADTTLSSETAKLKEIALTTLRNAASSEPTPAAAPKFVMGSTRNPALSNVARASFLSRPGSVVGEPKSALNELRADPRADPRAQVALSETRARQETLSKFDTPEKLKHAEATGEITRGEYQKALASLPQDILMAEAARITKSSNTYQSPLSDKSTAKLVDKLEKKIQGIQEKGESTAAKAAQQLIAKQEIGSGRKMDKATKESLTNETLKNIKSSVYAQTLSLLKAQKSEQNKDMTQAWSEVTTKVRLIKGNIQPTDKNAEARLENCNVALSLTEIFIPKANTLTDCRMDYKQVVTLKAELDAIPDKNSLAFATKNYDVKSAANSFRENAKNLTLDEGKVLTKESQFIQSIPIITSEESLAHEVRGMRGKQEGSIPEIFAQLTIETRALAKEIANRESNPTVEGKTSLSELKTQYKVLMRKRADIEDVSKRLISTNSKFLTDEIRTYNSLVPKLEINAAEFLRASNSFLSQYQDSRPRFADLLDNNITMNYRDEALIIESSNLVVLVPTFRSMIYEIKNGDVNSLSQEVKSEVIRNFNQLEKSMSEIEKIGFFFGTGATKQ